MQSRAPEAGHSPKVKRNSLASDLFFCTFVRYRDFASENISPKKNKWQIPCFPRSPRINSIPGKEREGKVAAPEVGHFDMRAKGNCEKERKPGMKELRFFFLRKKCVTIWVRGEGDIL